MAKISKWENLKAELERGQEEFAGIPNPPRNSVECVRPTTMCTRVCAHWKH